MRALQMRMLQLEGVYSVLDLTEDGTGKSEDLVFVLFASPFQDQHGPTGTVIVPVFPKAAAYQILYRETTTYVL
jgi:hypothetical protein